MSTISEWIEEIKADPTAKKWTIRTDDLYKIAEEFAFLESSLQDCESTNGTLEQQIAVLRARVAELEGDTELITLRLKVDKLEEALRGAVKAFEYIGTECEHYRDGDCWTDPTKSLDADGWADQVCGGCVSRKWIESTAALAKLDGAK